MSNFKVGDKCVCVEPVSNLIKGEIYTIIGIMSCCEILNIKLHEYKTSAVYSCCPKCGYPDDAEWKTASRFRPLHHEFAEEVISMLLEQPETVEV